jgi:hypothetical protein
MLALTGLTGCAAKTYKFGTGSVTTVSAKPAVAAVEAVAATKTTPAVEAVEAVAGSVQVTSVYVAVLLDDAGKVVYVSFDSAQNKGTFDTTGAVVKAEAAPTKKEKGADYGMKANSAIGKEWFEQIAALEAYLVGKTADEVAALEVVENLLTAEDIKASVSIKVNDYLAAFAKAVANAVEVKGVAKVSIGSVTTVSGKNAVAAAAATATTPAVEAAAGRVQANVMFTGLAFDKDGKVLLALVDTAQNQGTFDATGAIVKAEAAPTKKEKGADYGMKANSAIGKEWFEQAAALEAYYVGKTADEVAAIELDAEGVAVAEDLKTSVSIGIDDYLASFAKSVANAVEVK